MRRKSFENSACTIARALDVIGDWWSLLIVRDAMGGIRRFNEFQRSLEIPKNILTNRLKALVEHEILELLPAADGSAYQEYVLTERGRALMPVIVALSQWGSQYLFETGEQESAPVDFKAQRPLRKIELRSHDGRALKAKDIFVPRAPVTPL
jgi:DNA-binding HxlR family transcriptional regulator